MKRWTGTIAHIAKLAFWPALAFALVMAVLPKPPELPTDDLGDKFHHMLAFFTLTLLAGIGWPRVSLAKAGLRLVLLGAAIEVVQAIPALHRSADWRDLLADSLAVGAAIGVVLIFRRLNAGTPSA